MDTYHKLVDARDRWGSWLQLLDNSKFNSPKFNPYSLLVTMLIATLAVSVFFLLVYAEPAFAAVTRLPGEDASDKLEAAGTLLKILDTGLFKWGARVFAGICIMSSAWALKEQRFGIAIICVIGAIIFGTAPKWVKNIFEIGDNQSLFTHVRVIEEAHLAYRLPELVRVPVNA